MDTFFQIVVLLFSLFLGARLGGLGVGYAGGLGVLVLCLFLGLNPGRIPFDVILVIMAVISAISAMQSAGGLDYLVKIAEKFLKKHPKQINYFAPSVAYFLTLLAGTGHTAFCLMPVIVEVSQSQNIKPKVPLSLAVVSSQVAITASPVSAAVVFMSGILEPLGASYLTLLMIWISTTFLACILTAFMMSFTNLRLDSDPIYLKRLKQGKISPPTIQAEKEVSKSAKLSVWIFIGGVVAIVCYASAISKNIALIEPVILGRDYAIVCFMLSVATLMVLLCKLNPNDISQTSVFKSGMQACVCVLGVAWLGDTFVSNHIDEIKHYASFLIADYPFLLAVALFFASMLLYSQAATSKALIPSVIMALGISANNTEHLYIIVASFASVSALFVLPTYPTLLGAIAMDNTGTTKMGRYVFDHSFLIPGVLIVSLSVALGFITAPLVL
ncbi:anaerobic C4-dicarboxylate transporter [Helicobacter cetorum]|uniref:C4-dicarboxylate transporter DcuA n=1 Tax=Helicobacter cetorum (strain ATCC BAA-540 / CCUG 52418 / MIT 99-5656) TaxID=1163745 RepID=I0EQN4_HELCM|nr:anaerobic C4-dicarboxylate transporter [Helicobacter cetorum]AFI05253.1 anaerobic C4-dicarboxylate transporter [Helicobacter cetorum MIT 99-5656]